MEAPVCAPVIREFRPEDLPRLAEMYRTFEPRGAAKGLPPVRDEKASRWLGHVSAKASALVALVGERVAGHVILAEGEARDAEMALFVHQDFRNRGLGAALTRAALEYARAQGYSRLWLTVSPDNRAALRVYQKCGFRMIPQRSSPDHEMEFWLSGGDNRCL
jgi:ribosomal protein S18 acetylase RimI-like enzyme